MNLMDILARKATSLTSEKRAFQPMPGGQPPMDPAMAGGGMPMDPAMAGGQPPMDPAMAGGGMPMDPAAAGGMPPVDPATGMPIDPATGMPIDPATGMPIDPAMMGGDMGAVDPLVAELPVSEFKRMLREVVADVITGGPVEDDATSDKKGVEMGEVNEKLTMLLDMLGGAGGAPAGDPMGGVPMEQAPMAGEPAMMGAGAGVPVAAEGMEQQASAKSGKRTVADLIISKLNR